MLHVFNQDTKGYRPVLFSLMLVLILSLAGCASMKNLFGFSDTTIQKSAESLAIEGMGKFNKGNYYTALKSFQEILDSYPFSPQAMLAELKAADCHYYQDEFLEAKTLYQEFENRHPTNEAIPYVMFQIGMCNFNRIGRIDRDTSGAGDAIQSFSRLLRAYPDSPYTDEAKARIEAARAFMANHEYFVAIFYVRTNHDKEAAHRLNYLLTTYPHSAIAPKARALLARIKAGNPPKMGLSRWLPDLSLPDWHLFGPDKDKNTKAKPAKK